jgi:hypothetical protein
MDHPAAMTPVAPSPLLAAIGDLEKCHRDHVRYHTSAPRERADVLRRHADALVDVADRWATTGAPDPLATLRFDLSQIADDAAENGAWLEDAMESSWDAADSLLPLDEFADVLAERHRIIANDWQAALLDRLAGSLLRRACEILETVDDGSEPWRDPSEVAASLHRLRAAAEIVGRAAELLHEAAALGAENEQRWSVVRRRMEELTPATGVPADG